MTSLYCSANAGKLIIQVMIFIFEDPLKSKDRQKARERAFVALLDEARPASNASCHFPGSRKIHYITLPPLVSRKDDPSQDTPLLLENEPIHLPKENK